MKFNPTIGSDLSGSIGGVVASHNTYGPYFRRRARPVNRNTTGQQLQRAAFARVSQLWRSQDAATVNAWSLAGPLNTVPNKIGGTLALSGQALFMRINTIRQRIGLPLLSVAPALTDVPSVSQPIIIVNLDNSVNITFDAGDEWNAAGGGILVSASPLQTPGRTFIGQYTDVGQSIFPGGSPAAFTLPYSTVAGGLIRFRFRATTPDGRLSVLTYQDTTVPVQAIVASAVRTSGTTATLNFSRAVDVADFPFADLEIGGVAATAVIAGAAANQLVFTHAAFAVGAAWDLTPSGGDLNYTPPQSGVIVSP